MMAMYRRRLLIILTVAAVWGFGTVWLLIFNPNALHFVNHNRALFVILAFAGVAPIPFYYYVAKRRPYFAMALSVLAAGQVLNAICVVADFVFNLDNVWLDATLHLSQVLIFLSTLMFIWQAKKRSKAENKGVDRTDS